MSPDKAVAAPPPAPTQAASLGAAPGLRACAFLDRDGVINADRHHVHRIEDFEFLPGVIEAMQRLQAAGYALVVVTNQGGIALGLYDEAAFQTLTAHMRSVLAAHGVRLDGVYHCPHHPRAQGPLARADCACRKPAPGMMLQAAAELSLDLRASILVGDKPSDLQAAEAAGVPGRFLVRSGKPVTDADAALASAVYPGLLACAQAVLAGA